MNPTRSKAYAVLMVCVTSIGLLLSVFFLIQIWRYREPVTEFLQSGTTQVGVILRTTGDGLEVIDLAVSNVLSTTLYLDEATNALAQTIQSSGTFIDSAGTFLGDDLVNTITNTQSALDSAQASAVVIDDLLTGLSNIPLIGLKYSPPTPLNTALGKISDSLDPLQTTLDSFKTNLSMTNTDMQEFGKQLNSLDQNIMAINHNLASSRAVVEDYRSQVIGLQSMIDNAKTSLPAWVTTIAWILTLIVFWLVLVQISILFQAINLLLRANPAREIITDK